NAMTLFPVVVLLKRQVLVKLVDVRVVIFVELFNRALVDLRTHLHLAVDEIVNRLVRMVHRRQTLVPRLFWVRYNREQE
ncbi:hypothetical protein B8W96_12315, partial [Lentilactobacillus parakefiri]